MREGHSPAGWDAWGCPWAFMNVAQRELPEGENVWYHALAGGRVLIAILVRFAQEPYFFLSAIEKLRLHYPRGMDHKHPVQSRSTAEA